MGNYSTSKMTIEKDRLLLVEGVDEVNFFHAFFKQTSIDNIQIISIGGKTQLKKKLTALCHLPGFNKITRIGIIQVLITITTQLFKAFMITLMITICSR
jgi:hypothetical protein